MIALVIIATRMVPPSNNLFYDKLTYIWFFIFFLPMPAPRIIGAGTSFVKINGQTFLPDRIILLITNFKL